mgnify:CR=1 FL=1
MTGRACTECGGPHYARDLCKFHYMRLRKLGTIGRRTWPGAELVAEVRHLIACGDSPEQVADRLEMTPAGIAKALRRHGRPDLAPPFERLCRSRAKATP